MMEIFQGSYLNETVNELDFRSHEDTDRKPSIGK